MIRIRSKKSGFRRCGIGHPAQWTEYPDERFTKKELARLKAEPMLQVEVAASDAACAEPVKDAATGKKPKKA